jgi:hypothetical protein
MPEPIGQFLSADLLAFLLTLAVFSYLLGDNPFYRLAVSLFVGGAAGYAVIIAYYNVLYPQMLGPLISSFGQGPGVLAVLPTLFPSLAALLLTVFLFLKLRPATSRLGSAATAFLVGVGSAVAIGGAITGTLFPQTRATFLSLQPGDLERTLESMVIVGGTLATLGFFYYGGRALPGKAPDRPALVKPIAVVGQIFIGAAFGVMYAGALAASLAFLAERLNALGSFLQLFLGGS